MTDEKTIEKPYKDERAYLKIKGIIQNPQTMGQTPIDVEGRIDTGFDGGLFVPISYKSDLEIIKVIPRKTNITLADGRKIPAEVCFAYVQQIDNIELPAPGLPISLVICGDLRGHLIGMNFLKNCITRLEGPSQKLAMTVFY